MSNETADVTTTNVKTQSDRHRNWFGQRSYDFETHDSNGALISNETPDEWKKRVIREIADPVQMVAKGITKIYLIFHDKDVDEHGNAKPLHCHFVASFKDSDIWERVHTKLGCSERRQNCQSPNDLVDALRYLIHVSKNSLNEDKFIYPPSEVIAVSSDVNTTIEPYRKAIYESARKQAKQKKDEENEKKNRQKNARSGMLKQVTTGKMNLDTVRKLYIDDVYKVGFTIDDYYVQKKRYEDAERDYFNSVLNYYSKYNRCLTTVYICGAGGLGKTRLGFALAQYIYPNAPIHRPATSGKKTTFDFAGDYHGEHVTLFNEFSACFSVEQFCDVFDPIYANRVNSRNHDKAWFAELAILPTSVYIEQLLSDMWQPYAKEQFQSLHINTAFLHSMDKAQQQFNMERVNKDVSDKIRQVRRRIPIVVQLDDVNSVAHIYYLSYANNVAHIFLYDKPVTGQEPYIYYTSIQYDVNNPDSLNAVAVQINNAIITYYQYNKHTVTPWNSPRPDINLN